MFQERHLNFNKFLDDRAEQISKFREILKLDTKKKGHQALPKSIRRRAMSHNRFRIPSKMRKLNEEQLIKSQNMQRIPKCRKHIRKRNRLILSYKERHSKIKWLSTHLWAAKRMKMIDYYGYKVAETPNQKAFRSSYRNFMHNCCMIDLSYFQCLTVRFDENKINLPKNIKILIEKKGRIQKVQSQQELQCNRSYEGYLYNKSGQLICPLIVFKILKQKLKESQKSFLLRCFFNPCCLQQVKNEFIGQFSFSIQIQKCKSQLYSLIGPQWCNKLHKALLIYGLQSKIEDIQHLRFNLTQSKTFSSQSEIKIQKSPFISDPIPNLMKQTTQNSLNAVNIRNQTLKLLKLLNKKQQKNEMNSQESQKFWSFYEDIKNYSDLVNIKITTRSKYTHKRRNKLTKDEKKKVINLENKKKQLISSKQAISEEQQDSASHEMIEESLENIKNEIKQFFIEEKENKEFQNQSIKKQQKLKINPVLVTSFKKQSLYQGCYILCSDEDSCRLWRILSKLNVKIIGLQQKRQINLESQILSFPENYPETLSFKKYCEKQAQKQFLRLKRRPPSKRTNFIKINSPNPFSSFDEKIVSSHMKVFLQMVSRGRCFSNSYIYELNNKDISLIEKEMTEKGKVGIVESQTTKSQMTAGSKIKQKQYVDFIRENLNSVEKKLSALKEKRNLIGRVMTGGYLYSKSRQGGIAYVSNQIGTQKQNLKNEGYVLVRKVSSPHYYLAQITKIYPPTSY